MRSGAARVVRTSVGVGLGGVTGLFALVFLLAAGAALALTAGRARQEVRAAAGRLTALDRRRVHRFLGPSVAGDVDGGRALGYQAARAGVGLFGGLLWGLLLWGAVTVAALVVGWLVGWPVDDIEPSAFNVGYLAGLAAVLAFLNVEGILAVGRIDRWVADRLLGPGPGAAYERRIAELSTARSEVVAAVDAERRRIERDLHDGVQQRLVAVGMLLGRARRLPADAKLAALLRQAHDEAADALVELREVSWRVFPAALDAGGLPAALETVADRSPVPVVLEVDLDARPERAVETVAYFVVSEAVTNAVKHSSASRVEVLVRRRADELAVTVRDDGCGGASATGEGLTGLHRRVTALDGRFTVDSPAGGPTTVAAVLPCG